MVVRLKRSMLYATFYAKFQDVVDEVTASPTIKKMGTESVDPFNLDNIGDGYDVWTRGETQLLVLAVILVILTLLFAAIVALDCGRRAPIILHSDTLRDIVRHGATRPRNERSHPNNQDNIKAPPVSYLAPPPYADRRSSTALPV
uniref:Uncharacterized protein n=1 Tax=Caenorhabditis japonica TaxID=281687 RepID=A0A8R1DPV4_CAEJA